MLVALTAAVYSGVKFSDPSCYRKLIACFFGLLQETYCLFLWPPTGDYCLFFWPLLPDIFSQISHFTAEEEKMKFSPCVRCSRR